jgi:alpha-L-rhamnosidase
MRAASLWFMIRPSEFQGRVMRRAGFSVGLSTLLVMSVAAPALPADAPADGWITSSDVTSTPVVLHFRRELDLSHKPAHLPVTITADNRFILFVNGQRVASGPSTGTLASWRYSTVDLAAHLKRGHNVIAAVVWNFGEAAPFAQQSVATGFRLIGNRIATGTPGWRVKIDAGHSATKGSDQMKPDYYVASAPEVIDANSTDWEWMGAAETGTGWQDAVAAPAAAARTLVADRLPPQTFAPAASGVVVRSSIAGGEGFPARSVVIPAHSTAKLLLRRDAMISAYPALEVSGGKNAKIKLRYSEALYDASGKKGDRNLIDDRQVRGFFDSFIADGARRTFAPLWWRTFRFVELEVTTDAQPLTLQTFRVNETGYPFRELAHFRSSDPELDRIWAVGWRTANVDTHETYMDSSYWEQLQYTGDTRLEMLISYAVSGDTRLAEQAIDSFAESNADGGLIQGAYPSRGNNIIATFSLAWIGMLSDWSMEQPDTAVITRHLPRVRVILDWFGKLTNEQGLLGPNPQWNFIDWAGQSWDSHDEFPSYGKTRGSCLMTVMWLGALEQGVALEATHGDARLAAADSVNAGHARAAIREHCWDAGRVLFADNPDRNVFSQHMNILAVLYDVATPEEAKAILERITSLEKGIDAPPGMYTSTYYFAWYLVRAFEHAGMSDRYLALLQTWRELLKLNYTTWPESRGDTRSDTHAWSAHPTVDLLKIVAGIQPAAPGFARVRVEPHLGALTQLDARAVTPSGVVSVSYTVVNGKLSAEIDRPANLLGDFVWRGKSYPLSAEKTRLQLAN